MKTSRRKSEEEWEIERNVSRAIRRHHRQRMISHALNSLLLSNREPEERLKRATHNYNHLKSCSCWMCGNPRKWEGMSLQERRELEKAKVFEWFDEPIDLDTNDAETVWTAPSDRAWQGLCRRHHWIKLRRQLKSINRKVV